VKKPIKIILAVFVGLVLFCGGSGIFVVYRLVGAARYLADHPEISASPQFDVANRNLTTFNGQIAFGETTEEKALAYEFSTLVDGLAKAAFTGGMSRCWTHQKGISCPIAASHPKHAWCWYGFRVWTNTKEKRAKHYPGWHGLRRRL
jgi:hypothetical protein